MMHTLDFLASVWKSKDIKEELLNNLQSEKKEVMDIGVHRLKFDFKQHTVQINCNDHDYIFMCKMVPLEMSLQTLENLIEKDFDNEDNKWNLI